MADEQPKYESILSAIVRVVRDRCGGMVHPSIRRVDDWRRACESIDRALIQLAPSIGMTDLWLDLIGSTRSKIRLMGIVRPNAKGFECWRLNADIIVKPSWESEGGLEVGISYASADRKIDTNGCDVDIRRIDMSVVDMIRKVGLSPESVKKMLKYTIEAVFWSEPSGE